MKIDLNLSCVVNPMSTTSRNYHYGFDIKIYRFIIPINCNVYLMRGYRVRADYICLNFVTTVAAIFVYTLLSLPYSDIKVDHEALAFRLFTVFILIGIKQMNNA